MSSSMTDVLSPLASRMPRVVREHEVLRVAGWMPGDEPVAVAKAAIAEVLRWAQKRCGGQLPPEAWEGKSFDYLSGGRNSSCVHLQSGTSDLWAIRADDPDKTVAERVWTTEVVVGLLPSQPAKFSARLLVSTPEADLQIEPHTPGFIQQVVEKCRLINGQRPLSVAPATHETEADAEDLIDYLIDPSRQLPIFVVTLAENGRGDHPTLDTAALSRAILGIGHVALLHPAATWRLTERFGKFKSVFGGAARVYLPGFSDDAEPILTLAHLAGLDLRRAADGWHGIWQVDGVAHQFWLPEAVPDAAAFYAVTLPMDSFLELRAYAARRLWRSLNGRAPGPDFRAVPAQLRQWHILSLRALDARLRGESYRTIAEVLLGFRGTKEDFENDPRKNKARRLVAHGIKMMRGGYRLLLHYPIKPGKR